MNLTPIVHCSRGLDFSPRLKWPGALPAVAWNKFLITGFDRLEGTAIDLGATSTLAEAVVACYPSLGLGEKVRLELCLHSQTLAPLDRNAHEAAVSWGVSVDKAFLNWIDQRAVGLRELAIFRSLPQPQNLNPILGKISEMNLSRSTGVAVLELAGELLLLDIPISEILPPAHGGPQDLGGERWLNQLQTLRRPQSSERDQQSRSEVRNLPWPAHVRVEWVRWGDQAGLELKLRAGSRSEFLNRLDSLSRVRDLIANEETIWR